MFQFKKNCYKTGRVGEIFTPHGTIKTPAFVFCATKGSIKCLSTNLLDNKTQILLCNTFHLQNFSENICELGGIHKFMQWNGPIIADSGGYQVFSMGFGSVSEEIKGNRKKRKFLDNISEEGVLFNCPSSGKKLFLSPERSMEIQNNLGVDLVIAFDECTPSHVSYEYTKESLYRSHRWEKRSLDHLKKLNSNHQRLYGIIQGGTYEDLREESVKFVCENNFWGIAIGGSLGKTKEEMYSVVKKTCEKIKEIDDSRPIHLLGIGRVEDILELATFVDTFDCVEPTRIARHGAALIKKGKLNLNNSCHRRDPNPIDSECLCYTCKNFSRAYLHYLLSVKEMSVLSLLVNHNMYFMNTLMEKIRELIVEEKLDELKRIYL